MRSLMLVAVVTFTIFPTAPVRSAESEKPGFSVPDELVDAWERLQRALQDWGGQLRERFGARDVGEERPIISLILKYKDYLRLSGEQVKKLEQLRDSFQRQSIRSEAEIRIMELDAAGLQNQPNVDLPKVEQKIREIEKSRADLRIARIRVVEQAKAVLNAEQRKKFYESLESRPPTGQNPSTTDKDKRSP